MNKQSINEHYIQQVLNVANKASTYQPKKNEAVKVNEDSAKVISFYLPQFHQVKENDEWWGEGFTEWSNVTKAAPQFIGHHQPRLPDALGYYDLSDVRNIIKQIELAKFYGIHGFCFYYYWFNGRRILEKPVDLFLENKDIDFPFCICWANENWTRRWDGMDDDILLNQTYSDDSDKQFSKDIAPILKDERYIKIDGKPVMIVYRPAIIPNIQKRVDIWRELLAAEGVNDVLFYMVQGFNVYDPRPYNFDGAIEFPPHNIGFGVEPSNKEFEVVNPDYEGDIIRYKQMVDAASESPALMSNYPWIRGACPSWDNEARKPGRGWTVADSTPEFFKQWFKTLTRDVQKNQTNKENFLFINAWNEWAEGAHLEPDKKYGYGYLNALADILEGEKSSGEKD
jgi:hypothetical protein